MSGSPDEAFWEAKRNEVCLDPSEIYLNAGSFSPVPRPVLASVENWRRRLASSPMRTLVHAMPESLMAARQRLAAYLGCDAKRLLLLPNATHALNVAVSSLDLDAGSEIVSTDQEYGAMRYCLERAADARGWVLRTVSLPPACEDPQEIVDAFWATIGPATKVLFFSHVTSPTGLVLPVDDLCRLAKERNIRTVIDGAHAPGMVPLRLDAAGVDYYAGNCHKWMMAPTGAGFLFVSDAVRHGLQPLVTSWGWEFTPTDDRDSGWGGNRWSQRIEFQGTQDRCAQLVLPEVLDFRDSLSDEAVQARCRELSGYLRSRMEEIGYRSSTPVDARLSGSMTAFEVPSVDPIQGREWWWENGRISVPFTRVAHRTFLRVSTAWFNTREEIDHLVEHVRDIPFAKLGGS